MKTLLNEVIKDVGGLKMNDEVTINVEAIAGRISDEMLGRKGRAILSKLYAKCDFCNECFKISDLHMLEREKMGDAFEYSPGLTSFIIRDEPVRLVCMRCVENLAMLDAVVGPHEQVGAYAKQYAKRRSCDIDSTHMRDHWVARERYG